MKFYLDKLDKNNAWLIVAWDGTDPDNTVGWRVDSFDRTQNRTRTLVVFPTPQNVTSRIMGVLAVNLELFTNFSIYPVRSVTSAQNDIHHTDREVRKDFPEGSLRDATEWSVWRITAEENQDRLPELDITQEPHQPEGPTAQNSFVSPLDGNTLFPGRLSEEVDGPPVIEIRVAQTFADEEGIEDVAPITELLFKQEQQSGKRAAPQSSDQRSVSIKVDHLLAARDVAPLIERKGDHKLVINCFGTVSVENAETKVALLRSTSENDGTNIGLGFLDRIVLTADRDCVFEYWLDEDRQDFTTGNGLVVLAHLGNGELVQDSGDIRKLFYDHMIEEGKERDKPLFDKIADRPFKLPWGSNEKYSLPLQYACYDLCKTIHESPLADTSIVPNDMRMFAERPELYFALIHPHFSQLADVEYDNIEKRISANLAILDYCRLYLSERFESDLPETGVNAQDIDQWCSNIQGDDAWNLYELVISGAAEELIRAGISFDAQNAARFSKRYAKKRVQIANAMPADRPTPLRASTLGSKFQTMNEALTSLKSMESDWRMVEMIRDQIARDSGLFRQPLPQKDRPRTGLTALEFDRNDFQAPLREYITLRIQEQFPSALEKVDRNAVLGKDEVFEVVTSWLIADHDKDFNAVRALLKRVGRHGDLLTTLFLSVIDENYSTPKVSLADIEPATIEGLKSECTTTLGRKMIEKLQQVQK